MSNPCPRCGVPGPVVVSSDGALPPDLVMAAEVTRLREALEQVAALTSNKPMAVYGTTDMERLGDIGRIARAALGRTAT